MENSTAHSPPNRMHNRGSAGVAEEIYEALARKAFQTPIQKGSSYANANRYRLDREVRESGTKK